MCVGRRTFRFAARLGLASRFAGLWVVRASLPTPLTKGAENDVDRFPQESQTSTSTSPKSAASKKGSAKSNPASRRQR